jgi:DNA-binding transcriptional MerR regulator
VRMKNRFSIGEMSKLHNISVQTLRYYDKIDLFKPSYTDANSKYRYYSMDQFIYLDIIKYLKYIGTSLEEIKSIINTQNSIDDLTKILIDKEKNIDDQIRRLSGLKSMIRQKIDQLRQTSSVSNLGEVYVKRFGETDALILDLNGASFDDSFLSVRKAISGVEKNVYYPDIELGFIVDYPEYEATKKLRYGKMYMVINPEISNAVKEGSLSKIPSGDYLCILYRGFEKEAEEAYEILFSYIGKNKLRVLGNFLESSIIHGIATANELDYIIEVRIMLDKS